MGDDDWLEEDSAKKVVRTFSISDESDKQLNELSEALQKTKSDTVEDLVRSVYRIQKDGEPNLLIDSSGSERKTEMLLAKVVEKLDKVVDEVAYRRKLGNDAKAALREHIARKEMERSFTEPQKQKLKELRRRFEISRDGDAFKIKDVIAGKSTVLKQDSPYIEFIWNNKPVLGLERILDDAAIVWHGSLITRKALRPLKPINMPRGFRV